MKGSFFILCYFSLFSVTAQKNIPYPSSDSILVSGLVSKQVIYSMSDLASMTDTGIASLKIVNHHGEYKTTYNHLKLVPLKNLLEKSLIAVSKPREMGSVYFVCKAMDGYTFVYSYNELFNTNGPGIFIITAYNDTLLTSMPERPILLNLSNNGSGKIGVRGLKSIEVLKAF